MRKCSVNALDLESLTHVKIFYSPLFIDILKLILSYSYLYIMSPLPFDIYQYDH